MSWTSLMVAVAASTPGDVEWPTPEQVDAVLVPAKLAWAPTPVEWVVGGVGAAVFLTALVFGWTWVRGKSPASKERGDAALFFGVVGLLCTFTVMLFAGDEWASVDEFIGGQEQAASLLAGPLDQEHPGWIVAVGESGSRDEVKAFLGPETFLDDLLWRGRSGATRVEFAAYDPDAGRHVCVLHPVVTTTRSREGVGPDGPTSVGRSEVSGGLSCQEAGQ